MDIRDYADVRDAAAKIIEVNFWSVDPAGKCSEALDLMKIKNIPRKGDARKHAIFELALDVALAVSEKYPEMKSSSEEE